MSIIDFLFFYLPICGLCDIMYIYRMYATHIDARNLIIPFLTCLIAIARVQYRWWIAKLNIDHGIVPHADTLFTIYLGMFNTMSIHNLLVIFPYSIRSLAISIYFQYQMLRLLDLIIWEYTATITYMSHIYNNRNNRNDRIYEDMPTWAIAHKNDDKCDDMCLICWEELDESSYVHVCIKTLGNRVIMHLHVTDTVLQCKQCKCTLHLQCQMLCNGICPVCAV